MKFKLLNGRVKDFNVTKTLIDWTGESLSDFQLECKSLLEPHWRHDIVCEEFRIMGRMSIDFLNISKRIAVEVQGRQHSKYVPFMAGSRNGYLGQIQRDIKKLDWCRANNIHLVEIHPDDLPKLRVSIKTWFLATYGITL